MLYMAVLFLVLAVASLLLTKSSTPKPALEEAAPSSSCGQRDPSTQAFERFLSTPLQDIALKDVPGVGPKTLQVLDRKNVKTAQQLFGYFLYKERHEDDVRTFLKEVGLQGSVAKRLYDSMVTKADRVVAMGGRGYGSSVVRPHKPTSMMSTTAAHEFFMSTPLQDICLAQVPGVGEKTLPKLQEAHISSAEALFGYFLYVGRDEGRFRDWLKQESIDVHGGAAKKVHDAMKDKADVLCTL